MATVGPSATTLAGILVSQGLQRQKFFKVFHEQFNNYYPLSIYIPKIKIYINYIHAEDAHEKLTSVLRLCYDTDRLRADRREKC